jgi:putative heme degradation protein
MSFQRARLDVSAREVIAVLPKMDRIMINSRWNGALHERMGVVESVTFEEGWAICAGAEHASRIELGRIVSVIVDRTSIMGGEAYPRADFMQEDGTVLCSVISFSGVAPFDAALAGFGPGEELALDDKARPAPAEDNPDDAGAKAFNLALQSGQPVSVRIEKPGFVQWWDGVVEKVSASRGFVNVMRPDFHLHLRMGAVADWQQSEADGKVVMAAVDAGGVPTGLTVRGAAVAFAPRALETA